MGRRLMASDYEARDNLQQVARDLHSVATKDLRQRLRVRVREAAEPGKLAARAGALATLPRKGGLAQKIAGSKFTVQTRLGKTGLTARIQGASGYDITAMNRGRLRHKVFGRNIWVMQNVERGWFTDAIEKTAPVVRQRVGRALEDIQRELKN